jgi:hypothetical protein
MLHTARLAPSADAHHKSLARATHLEHTGRMNVIAFIVSFAIFLGGLFLMGWAVEAVGIEAPLFISGILAVALSIAIPVHVMEKFD